MTTTTETCRHCKRRFRARHAISINPITQRPITFREVSCEDCRKGTVSLEKITLTK